MNNKEEKNKKLKVAGAIALGLAIAGVTAYAVTKSNEKKKIESKQKNEGK